MSVAATALFLCISASAPAQQPVSSSASAQLADKRETYNSTLALSYVIPEGVFWTFVIPGAARNSSTLGGLAIGAWAGSLLTPPIVHWTQGGVWRGFGALGGNFGFELVASLFGAGFGSNRCGRNDEGGQEWICKSVVEGFFIGLAVGQLTWAAIDIFTPAYRPAPKKQTSGFTPVLAVTPSSGGVIVGIGGQL